MAKEIELTNGGVAIVDDEDFALVSQWRWNRAEKENRAVRCEWVRGENRARTIILSRFIMNAPDGVMVDHVNGDTLDNQKANLRLATCSQNQFNAKRRKDSTTGYKGVTFVRGRYMAQIQAKKVHHYLGSFDTPEEAAEAYNRAAKELHGEFARVDAAKQNEDTRGRK